MSLGLVVVIENDEDICHLVQAIREQPGFEVYSALTGREGVDIVRQKQPVVVAVDLGLPDIDGYEVLRQIRQFSNAHTVVLTGHTDETAILNAKLFGGPPLRSRRAPRRPSTPAAGWGMTVGQAGEMQNTSKMARWRLEDDPFPHTSQPLSAYR